MNVLIAIGVLGGFGLLFGFVQLLSSRESNEENNPRVEALRECMREGGCGDCGLNCGGCKQAARESTASAEDRVALQ